MQPAGEKLATDILYVAYAIIDYYKNYFNNDFNVSPRRSGDISGD